MVDAIEKHQAYLEESGRLNDMRRDRARKQLLGTAQSILMERVTTGADGEIDELAERIAARDIDPRTAAEQLIEDAR